MPIVMIYESWWRIFIRVGKPFLKRSTSSNVSLVVKLFSLQKKMGQQPSNSSTSSTTTTNNDNQSSPSTSSAVNHTSSTTTTDPHTTNNNNNSSNTTTTTTTENTPSQHRKSKNSLSTLSLNASTDSGVYSPATNINSSSSPPVVKILLLGLNGAGMFVI